MPKIDSNSSLNKPEQFLTQIGTVLTQIGTGPETNRDSLTGAYMLDLRLNKYKHICKVKLNNLHL